MTDRPTAEELALAWINATRSYHKMEEIVSLDDQRLLIDKRAWIKRSADVLARLRAAPDPAQLDDWIAREFRGHGAAIRKRSDPPIPGEPYMSMADAKALTRRAVLAFAAPDPAREPTEDQIKRAATAICCGPQCNASGASGDKCIAGEIIIRGKAEHILRAALAASNSNSKPELSKSTDDVLDEIAEADDWVADQEGT